VTVGAAIVAATAAVAWGGMSLHHRGSVLMVDDFTGRDAVITNHYAFWSDDPSAFRDPNWEVESGTVYRRRNAAWSGVPTDNLPNIDSSNGSGSQTFRMWTKRSDFGNVRVEMDLRNNGYTRGSPSRPAQSWDGVKVWLRRQATSGPGVKTYTSEVNRRQGNVVIQKTCGDEYTILASSPGRKGPQPARFGEWERVGGAVRTDEDGSVTIQVIRSEAVVLTAIDRGAGGCEPIRSPGRVGVRGDNTDFHFDRFKVRAN
jgi:hypothetical protein